jgi:hypothetical protein
MLLLALLMGIWPVMGIGESSIIAVEGHRMILFSIPSDERV